jgi:XTP/dITP diphosphohydrolase
MPVPEKTARTRILLASSNPHKLREVGELAPGVEIVAWSGPPIPEDGAFFQDNALQKAVFARDWARDWARDRRAANGVGDIDGIDGVIADDSGLCIDALFGGPGVLSARFAPHLSYPEKNKLLLGMVAPGESRRCRFVCVMAFAPMDSAGAPFAVSGTVEGTLADEPRGEGGFGYDPIFVPDGYGATFGELGQEVKNCLSHRGKAARKMMEALAVGGRVPEQMALPCKEEARW